MTDEARSKTRRFSSYIFKYWIKVGGIIRQETASFLINGEEIKGTSFIILVIVQKSPSMSTTCLYLEKKVSLFQAVDFVAVAFCINQLLTAFGISEMWNVIMIGCPGMYGALRTPKVAKQYADTPH